MNTIIANLSNLNPWFLWSVIIGGYLLTREDSWASRIARISISLFLGCMAADYITAKGGAQGEAEIKSLFGMGFMILAAFPFVDKLSHAISHVANGLIFSSGDWTPNDSSDTLNKLSKAVHSGQASRARSLARKLRKAGESPMMLDTLLAQLKPAQTTQGSTLRLKLQLR